MKLWSKIGLLIVDLICIGSIIAYILIQTDSLFQSPIPIGIICFASLLLCALSEYLLGDIGFGNKGFGQRIVICNVVFVLFIIVWFSLRNFSDIKSVLDVHKYNIVVPILWGIFALSVLSTAFGIIYYTGKAYFKPEKRKEDPIKELVVFEEELSDEDIAFVQSFDAADILLTENSIEKENIKDLTIPYPKYVSAEKSGSFVEYLQELKDIPREHPELAAIEQFALNINANTHVNALFDNLQENVSNIHLGDALENVKELLGNAHKASLDWMHNPDSNVTKSLMKNIGDCMQNDINSSWTIMSLHTKETLQSKLIYIGRKFMTDIGKGYFQTFAETDALSDVASQLGDNIGDAFENITSDLPHDLGLDMWSSDYMIDSHFPMASTALTIFKAGKQTIGEGADVEKTLSKAGVKIASTTSGVTIGSIIGNFIFPGAGGLIGAAIGGYIGKKIASDVNSVELKELQEQLDAQEIKLKKAIEKANDDVNRSKEKTSNVIKDIATKECNKFEKIKNTTPIDSLEGNVLEMAVCVVLRDYILQFVEGANDKVSKLVDNIPTMKQIQHYPRESVKSLLSILSGIEHSIEEGVYYNGQLVRKECAVYVIKSLILHQQLQCAWQNMVYATYKESLYNIFEGSEKSLKEHVDLVQDKQRMIDYENQKVQELVTKIKEEAKTMV